MKTLELFAGSRSFTKVAKEKGHETFCSDIEQFGDIDYVANVLEFDPVAVPFVPDMIWASPPCTGFSVASIGKHWDKDTREPKSETSRLGLRLLEKTLEIIKFYQEKNHSLVWYIENPRGMMRKMKCLEGFKRHTVTYCQYGDTRMKPTDIWTNDNIWIPKPACKNGDKCHIAAPRGSRTGTQGLKGSYERSQIPRELFIEILN